MSDTLPKLLVDQARHRGGRVAYRQKAFGIWQATTWDGYLERVRSFALGLEALGLKRGDRVAIVGDNRPEWVIAELAVQAVGGVSMGIYQDSSADEIRFLADFAGARLLVVEDQEQVDKVLEVRDRLPALVKVVFYDPRGLNDYADSCLEDFAAVESRGQERHRQQPERFSELVESLSGDDLAVLATTSGTTGKPKLAMLTHGNLLAAAGGLLEADPMTDEAEFLSFLPLAWIGEQMLSVACGLVAGLVVNFPEEPETVRENLAEIGPRMLFSPPRIWEDMVSEVQVRHQDASWLKRWIFEWAFRVGHRAAAVDGGRRPWPLRLQAFAAEWLCFAWIKDQLGLRRLDRAYTGGAALGPDVFRFFQAMGINFKQIYGQTEVAGISAAHRDGGVKFQTVGTPLPHCEIRVDDGEILTRGAAVFRGYFDNPAATAECLRDGWLHSGDAGYFDRDGHLVVIDRAKDVTTFEDGTKFSPQFLENKLKFSPYVREAVAFAGAPGRDSGPFVSSILVIDFAVTGKWAERHRVPYTTFTDLSQKQAVRDLIRDHVEAVNADLPSSARVRRFLLLHKELDADDAELTRTRKVRRRHVAERYGELVAALYDGREAVTVKTTIRYQDGRSAEIETELLIESVN